MHLTLFFSNVLVSRNTHTLTPTHMRSLKASHPSCTEGHPQGNHPSEKIYKSDTMAGIKI